MTIQAKFEKFHDENPKVLDLIIKHIKEVKAAGYQHYSIAGIFEQIRWHVNIQTNDSEFKLSNNHKPRYVRLVEEKYPEHVGFFITKKLTAA